MITQQQGRNCIILGVEGMLDAATSTQLAGRVEQLVRDGRLDIELDLDAVSSVDSAGLAGLVEIQLGLRDVHASLKLEKMPAWLWRRIVSSHLHELLGLPDDRRALPRTREAYEQTGKPVLRDYMREAERAFTSLRGEKQYLEQEVSKHHAMLAAALDSSSDYAFACDAHGEIIIWNNALAQLTGHDTATVHTLAAAVQAIIPGQATSRQALKAFCLAGLDTQQDFIIDEDEDDRRVLSFRSVKLASPSGQQLGVFVTATERTHQLRYETTLRNLEQLYSSIAESVSDGLALVAGGRVAYANFALAQLAGRDADHLRGLEFIDLLAPGSQDVASRLAVASADKQTLRFQSTLQRADGTLIPVMVTQTSTFYHDQPARLYTIRDTREYQRLEAYERLLTVCSGCGNMRESGEAGAVEDWLVPAEFLARAMDMHVSHSICPTCAAAAIEEFTRSRQAG